MSNIFRRQAAYLSNLPMNASACRSGHGGQVDDKVPDLSEEIICVGIPVFSCIVIRIRVDHCNALE